MKPHHRFTLALTGALLFTALPGGAASLAERWDTLRAEQPKLAARDTAKTLSVSEADLLATGIGKTVDDMKAQVVLPRLQRL